MARPPIAGSARCVTIGVRFTPEERESIEVAAEASGLSLSEYVRVVFFESKPVRRRIPTKPKSWAATWEVLAIMPATYRRQQFERLAQGRSLPAGFPEWRKGQKIAWLERNWRLC